MKSSPDFVSLFGSRPMGALRVAGFFTLIAVMVPIHLVYRVVRPKDLYRMPQLFHRILLRILKFRVRTFGAITAQPPTLFVSNHSSYLDIPVLAAILPAGPLLVAKAGKWQAGHLIGRLGKIAEHAFFVERRAGEASKQRGYLLRETGERREPADFPGRDFHRRPSCFAIQEQPVQYCRGGDGRYYTDGAFADFGYLHRHCAV